MESLSDNTIGNFRLLSEAEAIAVSGGDDITVTGSSTSDEGIAGILANEILGMSAIDESALDIPMETLEFDPNEEEGNEIIVTAGVGDSLSSSFFMIKFGFWLDSKLSSGTTGLTVEDFIYFELDDAVLVVAEDGSGVIFESNSLMDTSFKVAATVTDITISYSGGSSSGFQVGPEGASSSVTTESGWSVSFKIKTIE